MLPEAGSPRKNFIDPNSLGVSAKRALSQLFVRSVVQLNTATGFPWNEHITDWRLFEIEVCQ